MKPTETIEWLKNNQRQLDRDGCEVGVSRQALDELLSFVDSLSGEREHFFNRDLCQELQKVRESDWSVNKMLRGGYPFQHIVCQLAAEKADLMKKLMELEMIAPRKIVVGGKTLIYRAPDHIIPEISLPNQNPEPTKP